jgi:HPt (histidine-containing phosphotransfer) domain-containing protein
VDLPIGQPLGQKLFLVMELFLTCRRGKNSVGIYVNRIIRFSMDIKWKAKYIDPQNLIEVSHGDKRRLLKYLNRFQELTPKRIEKLQQSLEAKDRKMIRQTVHQMSPQLQFFGVRDTEFFVRRLEFEYETIPFEQLKLLVKDFLDKLEGVQEEVALIIKSNF